MATVRLRVNVAVLEWTPGEIVTVERTRLVEGLISGEKVTVLEEIPDPPAPPPPTDTVVFPDTITLAPEIGGPVRAELSAAVTVVPPRSGKGATLEAWREFVHGQADNIGVAAAIVDNATKTELIGLWDSAMAIEHPTPEE